MTRKARYEYILQYFREQMPEVQTELEFGSVFQLLVAVILSAQCTDRRVNMVTPALMQADVSSVVLLLSIQIAVSVVDCVQHAVNLMRFIFQETYLMAQICIQLKMAN